MGKPLPISPHAVPYPLSPSLSCTNLQTGAPICLVLNSRLSRQWIATTSDERRKLRDPTTATDAAPRSLQQVIRY